MNVLPMLPKWPQVRCDSCRTVYAHPDVDSNGLTLIVGKCPKCGHGTFSTTMVGTPGVTPEVTSATPGTDS